jgi:methyltransferase (TIGR00027 family)
MTGSDPLIRDISDTALWVAVFRARESERADAVFRDPLARRLAGERGEQIAASIQFAEKNAWSFIARTWIIDQLITEHVAQGVDLVVNLAAGLDTRPYRLDLPAALRWVEADLPPLIAYKEQVLAGERPRCRLERIALDLADQDARTRLFGRLGTGVRRALILTEGLLVYLRAEDVGLVAQDLAGQAGFQRWIIDLATPPLLRLLQKRMPSLGRAGSPLKFAPPEGTAFFERFGWQAVSVHSFLHIAARLGRLSWFLRLFTKIFSSEQPHPRRPWGGVVVLERSDRKP